SLDGADLLAAVEVEHLDLRRVRDEQPARRGVGPHEVEAGGSGDRRLLRLRKAERLGPEAETRKTDDGDRGEECAHGSRSYGRDVGSNGVKPRSAAWAQIAANRRPCAPLGSGTNTWRPAVSSLGPS